MSARHMKRLSLALAATVAASAAITGTAGGRHQARMAAANGIEAFAENVTPEAGIGIYVGVSGRITALSPRKGPRRCRGSRDVRVINFTLAGEKRVSYARPTGRNGRFELVVDLEYSATDEGVFYPGDVPESGGRVTFTVKAKPTRVPAGGPTDLELFKCKKLQTTTEVEIPPSR